ncbi:hypothetical protein ASD15_01320 [Massilia sp. Root351]|uniref:DUF4214 domain-containing protein n=1 Tax=Massilia sp. Root351 TaxID=1736522 RepID=UPI00070D6756|nr:DUF4214 domain-containing protein [Massilia sp. Root351]KQV90746.1 hypothetical protein ASD15_01320 [Massilia sp. Root351]
MNARLLFGALLLASMLAGCGGEQPAEPAAAMQPKLLSGGAVASAAAAVSAGTEVRRFEGLRSDYTVYNSGSYATVTNKSGVQVSVPVNSTLRFSDSSLVLGTDGTPAVVYRLYQAAFGRAPAIGGLTFWTNALDSGYSLETIAGNFIDSDEFRRLYGPAPAPNDFVSKLYRNILHRDGDPDGVAFWLTALIRGVATPPQVLMGFSESDENRLGVKAAMQQGIAIFERGVSYTPVARTGGSQEVLAGSQVQLDGTASTANGPLTYEWAMLMRPGGSQAVLANTQGGTPTFTPDVAGQYLVTLTVRTGATRSKEVSLLVVAKVIPELWKPDASALPAAGNYVYLQGSGGDYIVGNRSYLYRQSDAAFTLSASDNYLSLRVAGDQDWTGDFKQSGSGARLSPGYYGDLTRYPFQNANMGGLDWSGEGRGCNTLRGWFVVDKVEYAGAKLSAIDLRFEQHCEGGSSALRGQVHWNAADNTGAPGPVLPVPAGLWTPTVNPAGNSVYLESTAGDYIGGGKKYLYLESAATVSVTGNSFTVSVNSNGDRWSGEFVGMNSLSELKPGYYGGLQRYPFHNAVKGGMSWGGNGRGCNTLTGWFVIDKISYENGNVKELDARFEQHCEGGSSALRGRIRRVF